MAKDFLEISIRTDQVEDSLMCINLLICWLVCALGKISDRLLHLKQRSSRSHSLLLLSYMERNETVLTAAATKQQRKAFITHAVTLYRSATTQRWSCWTICRRLCLFLLSVPFVYSLCFDLQVTKTTPHHTMPA